MKKLLLIFLPIITISWVVSIIFDEAYLIKWLGVVLCALMAVVGLVVKLVQKESHTFQVILRPIGLIFVAIADIFLTLNPGPIRIGLVFFCISQSFFFIWILWKSRWKLTRQIVTAVCVIAALFTAMLLLGFYEREGALFCVLVSIYAGEFITNIAFSFIRRCGLLFSLGLIFYFICDIFVALTFVSDVEIFTKLVWVFYLPGLAMIGMSSVKCAQTAIFSKEN